MDSDTMVEVFKYLHYCQLAKNSLVSKRYWNLIRIHRHSLALLYVDRIFMETSPITSASTKVFEKVLSPEVYNKWVICNNYSKQIPFDDAIANAENTQNIPNGYRLNAYAHFKDPNNRGRNEVTSVFFACVQLNHEKWPTFQHFTRLITDPFIYIDRLHLAHQIDVLNLLSGKFNPDRRLQCRQLFFNMNGSSEKSIIWSKHHVRCDQFLIYGKADLNPDEALLDFFITAGHCTPSIEVRYHDLFKVVVFFVQKFMDLKNSNECNLVETIKGAFKGQVVELLNRDYAEFIVKEQKGHCSKMHTFEFVNNDIGKKLQLAVENLQYSFASKFSIHINNL